MKLIIVLLFILPLVGCKNNQAQEQKQETIRSNYHMDCASVSSNMIRCENQEVICYGSNGTIMRQNVVGDAGVSCKFKQ